MAFDMNRFQAWEDYKSRKNKMGGEEFAFDWAWLECEKKFKIGNNPLQEELDRANRTLEKEIPERNEMLYQKNVRIGKLEALLEECLLATDHIGGCQCRCMGDSYKSILHDKIKEVL